MAEMSITGASSAIDRFAARGTQPDAARVPAERGAGRSASGDGAGQPASGQGGAAAGEEPSAAELRQVAELRQIDRRVRSHELAHIAAGAGVVRGGASYQYVTGPDGQRYAVGGEVPIDASPGRTPEETLDKARAIRRAALAPADPSPTDRRVAAQATAMEAQASAEIRAERAAEAREAVAPAAGEAGVEAGAEASVTRSLALYRVVGGEDAVPARFAATA